MKTTFLAMLSAIAVLAAPCAAWGDEPNPGYLGASLGTGLAETCQDDLTPGSRPSCEDLATLKVFGGYHFNRNFAIEGAVVTLERDAGTAFELTGVGLAPLSERVALYGKLGGFVGGTQTGVTFGAGVRFQGETFGVRAEWQHYEASGGGDLVSLGVFFRF
jgi:hypothetical protein